MIRPLLPILLAAAVLTARENPFKPVIDATVLPLASNTAETPPPFKKATIALPSDARILKEVVIRYLTLEGAVKEKRVSVNRSVDWHVPLIVKPARDHNLSKAVSKRPLVLKPLPFLKVELTPKTVRLLTKDRKIRAFHLAKPFKIAVDFKRRAAFLTLHRPLAAPPYKALDIGNHDGYYRVVVTFDAPYRYRIVPVKGGYEIRLR